MVVNLKHIKSHPDKFLITQENGEKGHVDGVIENVKKLTDSKWAELVAIFHDLGKINPNFSNKLEPNKTVSGYANHAYFSAFAFFCAFACEESNRKQIETWIGKESFTGLELLNLTIIIAKHHGNLPDFSPTISPDDEIARILSKDENNALLAFLNSYSHLPIDEFSQNYLPFIKSFQKHLINTKIQEKFRDHFKFDSERNTLPLNFFLDTQFSFAALIQADKTDAARFGDLIDSNKTDVKTFCESYGKQLFGYLDTLNQKSPLNRLRTEIRLSSIEAIRDGLNNNRRVFDLTSPTGSGKTLMLLSLAHSIINETKESYRIIYALPFLSIIEQVEEEVQKVFAENKNFIQRIDSKSENIEFESLQERLESNPNEQNKMALNLLDFKEKTFAYPFIITTFVRFFETLLSNNNAELLKLSNLSNSIFLIDEIQSLPPRLYVFFTAYLTKFCEKFNCYAIFSTATQPNFSLPSSLLINKENGRYVKYPKEFFKDYKEPFKLLSLEYFKNELFNRYSIEYRKNGVDIETLTNNILSEKQSVLVILNTIDDTKAIYALFLEKGYGKDEVILLNTHFTPNDRKYKIEYAKLRLKYGKKVIVISTQLIEAGVDIDFPMLYRDFATVASIIQSAGRCNRNGKLPQKGKVVLFKLFNPNLRANLIYNGKDKDFLKFTTRALKQENYEEKELLEVQKLFFDNIQNELNFAEHSQNKPKYEFNFLKDIQECMFRKIGNFRLIDEHDFGTEMQYYVATNPNDRSFEQLLSLTDKFEIDRKNQIGRNELAMQKLKIAQHFKKMANQIVKIRLRKKDSAPDLGHNRSYLNFLYKINPDSYSSDKGVLISGEDCII